MRRLSALAWWLRDAVDDEPFVLLWAAVMALLVALVVLVWVTH